MLSTNSQSANGGAHGLAPAGSRQSELAKNMDEKIMLENKQLGYSVRITNLDAW